MENNSPYEKRNFYISVFSVIVSIMAGVIYVAVSLGKMQTQIDMLERLTRIETQLEDWRGQRTIEKLGYD